MSLDNVQLHLVESFEDARACWEWAASTQYRNGDNAVAVDTETTGFKWHDKDYVRTVQVGDAVHGWMIPWERWSGLFIDIMKHHEGYLDFMNAKFDWPFLRKAGIELPKHRIRDVGVMGHILEPHLSRALKSQGDRHVDPRSSAGQKDLDQAMHDNGWTWETVPIEHPAYWTYGALDTVITYQLRQRHMPIIEQQAPYAYEIESAFQWVALQAETTGTYIDVEHAKTYLTKFERYCDEAEAWVKKEYGILPGSNRKVIEILQRDGVQFDKQTKSGALSLDADVLEDIDHPLAQTVLRRRQLQKMASTYLSFYVEKPDANGLIHPSINTLGTRTSRMSMIEPNLQNVPVRGNNPGVKVVRNCISARPGRTLVFCDLDQIEMRGLAIHSQDPGLIAAFHSPDDFFVTVARNIFSDPNLIKSDPRRQPTKNSMYAKIYGAGIAKQAATAGVTFDQMVFVNQQLNAAYPGIERWTNWLFQQAMQSRVTENTLAFVTCPLTGRRHYADRGKEYALTNYLIQGWAAAVFKLLMLELDAAGLGEYIILFVHDEVILDVPNEDVEDVVQTLQKVMNNDSMFAVPISAGISTGPRWGEKTEWVKD
jgi:DNA polymerase I